MGGDIVHITRKAGLQNHSQWSMVVFQDELRGEYLFHNLEGNKNMTYKQSHFEGEKLGSWEITMEATRNQNDFTATFLKRAANIRQYLRIGSI